MIDSADRRLLVVAKRIVLTLVVIFALYILGYAVLSRFGAYAPIARSPDYVKWWEWAPKGTYEQKTGGWLWLHEFYSPLIVADLRYWHTKRHPDEGDRRYDLP
ncbi:MAG TPA: hypothetical protein VHM91_14745 [Verrucomicrobiales bacterium]|jgi:hypothetical protein|nr:hypothetical protein [Verrucomicrobiales bacterium]